MLVWAGSCGELVAKPTSMPRCTPTGVVKETLWVQESRPKGEREEGEKTQTGAQSVLQRKFSFNHP